VIRTLLIDNVDSFTFNLVHDLAAVNGLAPVVRPNTLEWTPELLEGFDNVVIGPGPGHPGEPADFGVCADILRHASIPVLGICLGHQGLATVNGGSVDRAPTPVHGLTSRVHHAGSDVFTGLEQDLTVVRYHSLAVTDVPASLRVSARSEDGVIMGLAHRTRPQFGVQFHPESICSQGGREILENFARITRELAAGSAGSTLPDAAGPAPARGGTRVPVGGAQPVTERTLHTHTLHARTVPLTVPAEELFAALDGHEDVVWLDADQGEPDREDARFSIIGLPSGTRVTADVQSGTVTFTGPAGSTSHAGEFLPWLDAELRSHRLVPGEQELPFAFRPGWVGYLGHELAAQTLGVSTHPSALPDAALVFVDRAAVIDHREGTVTYLALDSPAWPDAQAGSVQVRRAPAAPHGVGQGSATQDSDTQRTDTQDIGTVGPLQARHDQPGYLRRISAAQEQIAAGESYEICLTNRLSAPGRLDGPAAYRRLRRASPAPFGAYLRLGGVQVLSTSPERFLRVDADGTVVSSPIKGTRPRSEDPDADAVARAELAASEKDRAENLMIVDLVRHDLGQVAALGSVRADRLFEVHSFPRAHQMVSTVTARLAQGRSAVDAVAAAFPPGSMTGAPKVRTLQIIAELEGGPRGVYAGALGWFGLDGAAELSVVIRTLVATGEGISYGTGGAVVALSSPLDEYQETVVKAAPLLGLLGQEFPGRGPRVLAADSWLVQDGAVRAFSRHRARFEAAVARAGVLPDAAGWGPGGSAGFWRRVARETPREGAWFPRVAWECSDGLTGGGEAASGRAVFQLRPAPERSGSVSVWIPPFAEARRWPGSKGPDLAWLVALRAQARARGADEALLLVPDGSVVEAANSSLLWWDGEVLCVPETDGEQLPGVTAALVVEEARRRGLEVRRVRVRPEELEGHEVWLTSALQGIRPVSAWLRDGAEVPAPAAPRAAAWRAWLDGSRESMGVSPE